MMKSIWTSFFKARLNCSIPGEYPFYLDEIRKCQQFFFKSLFRFGLFTKNPEKNSFDFGADPDLRLSQG